MNVLFLTLAEFNSIEEKRHAIYTDLLNEFRKNGHKIYIISPVEAREGKNTYIVEEENCRILRLRIGNIQKTNVVEKGISTLTIEKKYISGIKKYFSDVKFDLILYSTPPITFCKAVKYVKERDNAKTYLLLKDIFPQNSVDLGMLSKTGVKGLIYKYFRRKEKVLYDISDKIGCMSPANVEYVLTHNNNVKKDKIEVCPNSIDVSNINISEKEKAETRAKYNIPVDKTVFIYGGNLGKPQDIPFLIKCLESQKDSLDKFFLIAGSGTDYHLLKEYVETNKQANLKLMEYVPKEEFDKLVMACDVGMIFLDHRFTIPNFPSRLLTYLQAKLPIITVTDSNTDIGKIAEENGFGFGCLSDDVNNFIKTIDRCNDNTQMVQMGLNGYKFLCENYSVEKAYDLIVRSFNENSCK